MKRERRTSQIVGRERGNDYPRASRTRKLILSPEVNSSLQLIDFLEIFVEK